MRTSYVPARTAGHTRRQRAQVYNQLVPRATRRGVAAAHVSLLKGCWETLQSTCLHALARGFGVMPETHRLSKPRAPSSLAPQHQTED